MKKILLLLLITFASLFSKAQPLQNTTWACYNPSNAFFRYFYFGTDTLSNGATLTTLSGFSIFSVSGDTVFFNDFAGSCVSSTGVYTYTIQNDTLHFNVVNDPCSGRLSVLVNYHFIGILTGIQGVNSTQHVEVFPNPSSEGIFYLTYDNTENSFTMVTVTNTVGEKVFEEQLSDRTLQHSLNLQDLAPGIYLLNLQNKNLNKVIRISRM
jgi:hypothetical protein